MTDRERSWWGWGWADQAYSDARCAAFAAMIPGLREHPVAVPSLDDIELRDPRIRVPSSLAAILSDDPVQRAGHTYGKAYRDVIRSLAGDLAAAPDLVARARTEEDVVAVLDWASDHDVAVVPYGGGSSVVGGVEYRGDAHDGVVSLDLSGMDRVLEIDRTSRAARIQGGALGPVLEDQLRPEGYTLRHFPQSFEFSTLGGWLATRAGGHYATLHTHIDDFVESMRVVTPVGTSESWRLPGSGAGPSPDRLFLGSEGTLGVITEAWMRLQERPSFKRSTSATFDTFGDALAATRAIAQSGLHPANCRLLDPGEAAMSGIGDGTQSVLVLGVESAHSPVNHTMGQLTELARDHGGRLPETEPESDPGRDDAADTWRSSFLHMPYQRDGLARMGGIVETFETATTWDRIEGLYRDVLASMHAEVRRITGSDGLVNCRFTHVYPDGAAPYFTVIAAGRPGEELRMWDELKAVAMELLTSHGATVTHHHAVGRDHRPGYDRQRPEPFAVAMGAAKSALDPAGILNPGVLFG